MLGIDLGFLQDHLRVHRADAVNVAQRDIDALFARNYQHLIIRAINIYLTLPLFVPRIRANHANHAFAPNHFAIFAKLLN